ncbi:MAG: hypothetical protein JWP97_5627 [Labilithrix sp.]|nr:hypothetical protein [Labilithrix sp.]
MTARILSNDPDRTNAQPPLEDVPARLHPRSTTASGAGAIEQTMKHALHHMGVRRSLTLVRTNQPHGFDCPGCAWPEPDPARRASVEFCENGAKAVASEATLARATPELFARYSVAELGAQTDYWHNEQGRLTHPMYLRKGATHYEPIGWDDAFALIARHLNAMESPDRAAFYTSGRTSNEAAFLYQLFARQLGTNNLPDCSNMCHESSGLGLSQSIGVGKGTVTLEDFDHAEAIFLVGQNPGTNHPRMLTTLREARLRGCTIVAVNPLDEVGNRRFAHPQQPADLLGDGVELSSLFLQVRVNGDVALFKGITKKMLEEEDAAPGTVFDHAFIEEHTEGYEALVASLRAADWGQIIEASGIPKDQIDQAARIMIESKRTIICWAMGLTQHKNGVANVHEMVNTLLLRGNMGKLGAGACPVRGHSNVQGDRTMGIWEQMAEGFLANLSDEFGFRAPRKHGYDAVDTIKAMVEGRMDVFISMGGNFAEATPDTEVTARGLRRCKLTVQVQTKLNRAHVVTGEEALILPCLGRTEIDLQASGPQFVSVENSMSVVSKSEGHLPPASKELKSEVAIICGMAQATLGGRSTVDWSGLKDDYDRIRDHVSRVVPHFEDYNARVRKDGGFYLGNAARERLFRTLSGKAHFTVTSMATHDLSGGKLLMTTIRSHDQYNTTIYGLHDRYRGVADGRRVIFMNPLDAEERGLVAGDWVDIIGCSADDVRRVAERFAVTPYSIPRGNAATYFPETNVLVPLESIADGSRQPVSKSVLVTVERSATA